MNEETSPQKKQLSPDWFVHGILTKLGNAFDRLLGRDWKPSSSLATSELIEKLKRLVDSEARESHDNRKFVPHKIILKMQWDKFSVESEDLSRKLETELLTALVDHINDKRYYTYAPITLEVKTDYFTDGIKLFAGFEELNEDDGETAINMLEADVDGRVTATTEQDAYVGPSTEKVIVRFEVLGVPVQKELIFEKGKRLTLGRTKENDITVDDSSVSKMHASLLLNAERQFVVADTGSTNGTFVDGERISYGKAVAFSAEQKLKLGTVELALELGPPPAIAAIAAAKTDTFQIGEFEFSSKTNQMSTAASKRLAETIPSSSVSELLSQEQNVGNATITEGTMELNLPEDEKQT